MPRHRHPFALLILDCDGVVVDSEPITMRVLAAMLSELGVSIETAEAARRFTGHTFAAALAAGMSVYGFAGSEAEKALLAAGAHAVFRHMADLPDLVAGGA